MFVEETFTVQLNCKICAFCGIHFCSSWKLIFFAGKNFCGSSLTIFCVKKLLWFPSVTIFCGIKLLQFEPKLQKPQKFLPQTLSFSKVVTVIHKIRKFSHKVLEIQQKWLKFDLLIANIMLKLSQITSLSNQMQPLIACYYHTKNQTNCILSS